MTTTHAPLTRLLAAAAIAVAGVALTGCSMLGQITNQTERDENGEVVAGNDDADVFSIKVGDCLEDASFSGEVMDVPIVPCSEPHDAEAYLSSLLPDGDFPGDEAVQAEADEACAGAAFEEFVGLPFEESTLSYTYLSPTEASWAAADREILCMVLDPAGKTEGSLEGSKK